MVLLFVRRRPRHWNGIFCCDALRHLSFSSRFVHSNGAQVESLFHWKGQGAIGGCFWQKTWKIAQLKPFVQVDTVASWLVEADSSLFGKFSEISAWLQVLNMVPEEAQKCAQAWPPPSSWLLVGFSMPTCITGRNSSSNSSDRKLWWLESCWREGLGTRNVGSDTCYASLIAHNAELCDAGREFACSWACNPGAILAVGGKFCLNFHDQTIKMATNSGWISSNP